MSAIKYRAFHRNKMMDVLEIKFDKNRALVKDAKGNRCWVDGGKIMQSTGFKDRNGIDVYEGDKLKLGHEWADLDNKYVSYHNGFMTFAVTSEEEINWVKQGSNHFKYWDTDDTNVYLLNQLEGYEVEVVGHIYENPELLT